MQSIKFTVAICLLVLLSACPSTDISQSKFVKQSEICQTYNLTADEENNRLSATVFFRFGGSKGTTLILNDSVGSYIKMENEILELTQNNAGAYYHILQDFTPNIKHFIFKDGDGKLYQNELNCEAFKVYNVPSYIDRNEVLELNYEGGKLGSTEQLICEYKDTAMAFSSDFIITEHKTNKIYIPTTVLQKMKNGPITMRFSRSTSVPTQAHGSIPGYMNYEYKGVLFKCTLKGKDNVIAKNED